MNHKWLSAAFVALLLVSIAAFFWLGKQNPRPPVTADNHTPATSPNEAPRQPAQLADASGGSVTATPAPTVTASAPRTKNHGPGSVIEGEVILHFDDRASYEEALRLLTEAGVPLRGGISSLGMLRAEIPAGGLKQLRDLLGDRLSSRSNNIRVALPQPIEDPTSGQLTAFGRDWLAMLGVPEDNADWGRGVKIAVIDAGVTSHDGLNGARIQRISLVEEIVANGHGNAVTSIIVGNGEPGFARGLAPAAEILAFQAMGAEGGNSFTVAQAIVDAVDRGANVVNLSLGGWGDTPAIREAIDYANEAGAVIVAAVGNDRLDQIAYPAAYDGVIAVTAVDAGLHWAEFPNAGLDSRWPDIAAPGVGLPAAYLDDNNIAFSGTSAATPVVSAAIAAHMSETGSTARQSADVVLAQTNDRGEPGADPYLGAGVLDMTRIMRANERGVYDLAVSDHYVDVSQATNAGLPVRIGVQNRGTEIVNRPVLTLMLGTQNNRSQIQLAPLMPGEVTEFEALIPAEYFQGSGPVGVGAIIETKEAEEINLDNNVIVTAYGVTRTEDGEVEFIEARKE